MVVQTRQAARQGKETLRPVSPWCANPDSPHSDVDLCAICREENDSSSSYTLEECKHRFHTSCLIRSFRYNPRCPMCRDGKLREKHSNRYMIEVFKYRPPPQASFGYEHLGYMRCVFRSKIDAAAYYNMHNAHMLPMTADGNWQSGVDPDTYRMYVIRTYHGGLYLKEPPFCLTDEPRVQRTLQGNVTFFPGLPR